MKFKKFMSHIKDIHSELPEDTKLPSEDWFKENIPKADRESYLEVAVQEVVRSHIADHFTVEPEGKPDETADVEPDEVPQEASEQPTGIDATLAERGNNYGKFTGHSDLSQTLKIEFDDHVRNVGNPELFTNSMNEAIEMIMHKLARIANGDPTYDDSWRDISGYATLIVKELNGEEI